MTEPVKPPFARLQGRLVLPHAPLAGVEGIRVRLRPDPKRVFTSVDGESVIAVDETVCSLDERGHLVGPDGSAYVDLLAPGAGVQPEGEWTYELSLCGFGFGGSPLEPIHILLAQGKTHELADLVPVAAYVGDAVTVAEAAAREAAAKAAKAEEWAMTCDRSASFAAQDAGKAQAAADEAREAAKAAEGHAELTVAGVEAAQSETAAAVRLVREAQAASQVALSAVGEAEEALEQARADNTRALEAVRAEAQAMNEALASGIHDGAKGDKGEKGDRGEKGEKGDKGDPAPPPAFRMRAHNLDPGRDAAVWVSGRYPELSVEFGIPRGYNGDPTDWLIVGRGRPDKWNSMEDEIKERVKRAQVGCEFISTDNAGCGAYKWIKTTPRDWVVTVGWTDWYHIPVKDDDPWIIEQREKRKNPAWMPNAFMYRDLDTVTFNIWDKIKGWPFNTGPRGPAGEGFLACGIGWSMRPIETPWINDPINGSVKTTWRNFIISYWGDVGLHGQAFETDIRVTQTLPAARRRWPTAEELSRLRKP